MGALGTAWPHLRAAVQQALIEALGMDTSTVLVRVLKSLQEVRAKGEVRELGEDALERLRQLARQDAKRFERLTCGFLAP